MPIRKVTPKKRTTPARKKTAVVSTLRGADAWNKKPARRKSTARRMSGTGKNVMKNIFGEMVQSLKPVAGAVGSEIAINAAVESGAGRMAGNVIGFIAANALKAMAPKKHTLLHELANGVSISTGRDIAGGMFRTGGSALSGYSTLGKYENYATAAAELGEYETLSGDLEPVNTMQNFSEYADMDNEYEEVYGDL